MKLFDLFKKKIERTPAKEFIDVDLEIHFIFPDNKKNRAEQEIKLAFEIMQIFNTTITIFNKNGEFLGAVNQLLNKDAILTYSNLKGLMSRKPSKQFNIRFDEKKSSFILSPNKKEKLYSIKDLYWDFFDLFNASKFLEDYYGLPSIPSTFNVKMVNGKPAILQYDKLVTYTYLVEDRLKYENGWEDYAKKIFPCTIKAYYNSVKENRGKVRDSKKGEEETHEKWLIAVEKLLGN